MNTTPIALPADFDPAAFQKQLTAWLAEGYAREDILSQAQHTWPELPPAYTKATLRQLRQKPIDPLHDLHRIHRRRARHLHKVEKALQAEDAPVSLHNLYRGLLRDHEAACYKLIETSKQADAANQKQDQARELKKEIAAAKQFRQESKQLDKELAATTTKVPSRNGSLTAMSWLIGFILSLFLTGCSGAPRTASTFLYTVSRPQPTLALADCPARRNDSAPGTHDVCRQRTPQLHVPSTEDHQALLQRTADDHA